MPDQARDPELTISAEYAKPPERAMFRASMLFLVLRKKGTLMCRGMSVPIRFALGRIVVRPGPPRPAVR